MKITNELGLPKPFVDAVSRDYQYKGKRYSVTQILKGHKEAILERRHSDEIEADVSDMIWMIFGTAIHKVLEHSGEDSDELKEEKIYIPMSNGYILSGIPDLYSESRKRVTDYKSTSVFKVIKGEWEDYQKQLLSYAWMLSELGFPVDNAENVLLLKDWSKSKAERESDYPKKPVYIKHYDFTPEMIEEAGKMLQERFREVEELEKLADDDIPPCSEKERWTDPEMYAVMKPGRKSAVKLLTDCNDAWDYAKELGASHYVEIRKGSDRKCEGYCNVCQFCHYWREKYGKEDV